MTSIVKFEGIWGVGDETPHCYMLTIDDFTFLLDCGWDEKFDKDYIDRLTKIAPRIDCVLLSYPDPLHMGALPYLVGKLGVSCPIYCTLPVYKMGQMFMYDWFQSHHNYDEFEFFTLDNVDSAFDSITQVKYNQSVPMRGKGMGLNISAQPAGHIIGGSIWRISRDGEEEDIVYAVDFNHKKERHLGGCELEKLSRPSLLITDAFNATYRQERRRLRDEKFVAQLQDTCRSGGNVLVATDTAGRVLEMTHMLEQMWSTKESGLAAYTLAILSNTGYHAIHFAKQMIEWMSEKLIKSFDVQRNNPFSFKHVKFCHTINDLNRLSSPKVVLASFPDLECGYSRELFIQWATNPKNTIILTSRTGKGTLARVLIDNPEVQTFRLVEKKRVKLEGDELDAYMKVKLKEHKARIKEELMIDDSDESGSEDEVNILEPGQHDIVLLQEKPGTHGLFRSKKHHPMFPFQEEKMRSDDYGEFINPEDFEGEATDENKENIQKQIKNFRDDEIVELEEPPTKCISQTVTVRLAAQVLFIDFEGRSDGESVLKILESVHPTRVILVRGVRADTQSFAQTLSTLSKAKVFTPALGEVVDASLETYIYQVRLSETLVSSLLLQPASGGKEVEVAWLDGRVTYEQDKLVAMSAREERMEGVTNGVVGDPSSSVVPTLMQIHAGEAPFHDPVFINEMRLSDFKQVLSRAGIESEFNAGILWCANGTIALRRQETGTVAIEGCLSEDYFEIKDLLYSQYAIL